MTYAIEQTKVFSDWMAHGCELFTDDDDPWWKAVNGIMLTAIKACQVLIEELEQLVLQGKLTIDVYDDDPIGVVTSASTELIGNRSARLVVAGAIAAEHLCNGIDKILQDRQEGTNHGKADAEGN